MEIEIKRKETEIRHTCTQPVDVEGEVVRKGVRSRCWCDLGCLCECTCEVNDVDCDRMC